MFVWIQPARSCRASVFSTCWREIVKLIESRPNLSLWWHHSPSCWRHRDSTRTTNRPLFGLEAIARVSWNYPHPHYPLDKGHLSSTCWAIQCVLYSLLFDISLHTVRAHAFPLLASLPAPTVGVITHLTHACTVPSAKHYGKLQEKRNDFTHVLQGPDVQSHNWVL